MYRNVPPRRTNQIVPCSEVSVAHECSCSNHQITGAGTFQKPDKFLNLTDAPQLPDSTAIQRHLTRQAVIKACQHPKRQSPKTETRISPWKPSKRRQQRSDSQRLSKQILSHWHPVTEARWAVEEDSRLSQDDEGIPPLYDRRDALFLKTTRAKCYGKSGERARPSLTNRLGIIRWRGTPMFKVW